MSGTVAGESTGGRSYRHRGPRRATGGGDNGQGEPQRLAGFSREDSEAQRAAGPAPEENRDDRDRWLLEQRPPHWG